jgi:Flp pilus assembly CpaE family ATPase
MQITATAIDTLFSVLRSQFHYIIVDVPRIPAPAFRRALEIADRRVIVVDQTMRAMRDAVRLAKMFGDGDIPGAEHSAEHRNIFIVNRVGEHHALSLKDVHTVLQVQATSMVPFLPTLVTPAAHHGRMAADKRGKFAAAVATLALELSGRKRRQKWWRRAAK